MDNNGLIKPAICCLGYNRPNSMRRLLKSIGVAQYNCKDIALIISIDECEESDEVQKVAENFRWNYGEKIIKRYPERLGVKKHTLAVGDLSQTYGAVIYLEDDIVVAPGFYIYTYEAVNRYKDTKDVFGVALYNQRWLSTAQTEFIPAYTGFDTFYFCGDVSWGQCWMAEQWRSFHKWYDAHEDCIPDYNKNVPKSVYLWNTKSSWSKFISFYLAETQLSYVVPYHSYSSCYSDKGVHTGVNSDQCQVPLSQNICSDFRFSDSENTVRYDAFFERKDRFVNEIQGIDINDICIDLNGEKYDFNGYKALLSIKNLDYEVICSYGLSLDPIEVNITYGTHGDNIKLYKLPQDQDLSMYESIKVPVINKKRIFHQIGKYRFKSALSVLNNKIRNHVWSR